MDDINPMDIPEEPEMVEDDETPPSLLVVRADTAEFVDARKLMPAQLAELVGGRCVATAKRTQSDEPAGRCKNTAIPGGTVCRFHGGAAPQAIQAAAKRIEEARDLALQRLTERIDEEGDIIDPAILLNTVVKLTEKAELLRGRATNRTEDHQTRRTEQIRAELVARLDQLEMPG